MALNRKTQGLIRKSHRYLGLFLGIQFIFWTVSGLYFSWTDIDAIHVDDYRIHSPSISFDNLLTSDSLFSQLTISKIALRDLNGVPHFWINGSDLYNASSGKKRQGISKDEALYVASQNMIPELSYKTVELIVSTDAHHEYRGSNFRLKQGPLHFAHLTSRDPHKAAGQPILYSYPLQTPDLRWVYLQAHYI